MFPAIAQNRTLKIGALISQADARGQDEMIQPYDQQMKLGLELAVAEINRNAITYDRPMRAAWLLCALIACGGWGGSGGFS